MADNEYPVIDHDAKQLIDRSANRRSRKTTSGQALKVLGACEQTKDTEVIPRCVRSTCRRVYSV